MLHELWECLFAEPWREFRAALHDPDDDMREGLFLVPLVLACVFLGFWALF